MRDRRNPRFPDIGDFVYLTVGLLGGPAVTLTHHIGPMEIEMKKHLFLLVLLAVFSLGESLAAPPDNSIDIIKHLEFEGYDVSMDSNRIKATHSRELNVLLQKYRGGMLVTAFFGGSDYGKQNRGEWLVLINKLNQGAAAARYYIDKDGDMAIEAYYPGEYNKKAFSAFLDAFNLERSHLSEVGSEIRKFLK